MENIKIVNDPEYRIQFSQTVNSDGAIKTIQYDVCLSLLNVSELEITDDMNGEQLLLELASEARHYADLVHGV